MSRRKAAPALAILAAVLAAPLVGCGAHGHDDAACSTAPNGRPTASGYCVPRWLSLKTNEVLARAGPGFDYRAQWTYRARGLPVQVVAETEEWRRICDPDGGAVWVHRSQVDGRRTVMSPAGQPTPLLANPQTGARQVAVLIPRSIATFGRCQNGWCRVTAENSSGWAPQTALWGTAVQPVCR